MAQNTLFNVKLNPKKENPKSKIIVDESKEIKTSSEIEKIVEDKIKNQPKSTKILSIKERKQFPISKEEKKNLDNKSEEIQYYLLKWKYQLKDRQEDKWKLIIVQLNKDLNRDIKLDKILSEYFISRTWKCFEQARNKFMIETKISNEKISNYPVSPFKVIDINYINDFLNKTKIKPKKKK